MYLFVSIGKHSVKLFASYKMVTQNSNIVSDNGTHLSSASKSEPPNKDLRSEISDLFSKNVQILADSYRGQFSKSNGLNLFEIRSPEWVEPFYWTLDMKIGKTYPGKPVNDDQPETTYLIGAQDMIALFTGRLESSQAYLSGKVKVIGNLAAALKFQRFLDETVRESILKTTKNDLPSADQPIVDQFAPVLASIPVDGLKCDVVFGFFRERLANETEIVTKMPFVIQINVTKDKVPVTAWTIDTKTPGGKIYRSAAVDGSKAEASLTIEDDDYINIIFGKLNPERAFFKGQLKAQGNLLLLQRLNRIWTQIQASGRYPEVQIVKQLLLGNQLQKGLRSEIVIFDLIERLVRMPSLLPGGVSVAFNITKNDQIQSQWLIGYDQNGTLSLPKHQILDPDSYDSISESAQLELTLDDDDFVRLCRDPSFKLKDAISTSRISIKGNKDLVIKLEQLFQYNPAFQSKL